MCIKSPDDLLVEFCTDPYPDPDFEFDLDECGGGCKLEKIDAIDIGVFGLGFGSPNSFGY